MEQITISGLKVSSLIGVYDWERTRPTTLLMDIEVKADLSQARHSDEVADTIDYAKLAEFVQQQAASATFELLEALGHALCEAVLQNFPVQQITLAITKPEILADAQAVTVTISAGR
ncbi:dihydroneopterin aldolase [Salinimonas marina]|uniref:7,8-dihydroneopterin aldolase n=1 Tax=Salinimonas marina TaxID=2785918 RepID=A0A7S9DWE8_9ALTE|nr:dihydroneopterin aldolase [Salinimonas marina]QPG05229.1 dihydroneopterin aldolase [Salinimonas marina]